MDKLSVVISVYNGEQVLEDCLQSVAWADEIVVVDHDSNDSTVSIAKRYTKTIYSQKNDPTKIDIQKNYGFEKAKNEWILSLDADERVSEPLAKEIRHVISQKTSVTGYLIPRKNIIFGKWIEHSLWWPDYQLRLFQKGKGRFTEQTVHKQLKLEGEVGKLTEPLIHENYRTISEYIQKMDRYTDNEASALIAINSRMHYIDAFRMPVRDFLKTFFLQEGYKDGLHGLVLSTLQAFYTFLVVTKVWEKQGFKEENTNNFLKVIEKEWRHLQKEISYWFLSAFISSSKNPLKKLPYKLQRKVLTQQLKK